MEHLILLLETYKYYIVIPLAILEGPILAIIVGFLVTLKVFNLFIVFVVLVMGDVIGDSFMYTLGRWGGKPVIDKVAPFLGITDQKLGDGKKFFDEKHVRAVMLSKLVHGLGFIGLITAGILKVPYRRFALTCIAISIAQIIVMITIGVFFGHAYVLLNKYLNFYAAGASIITALGLVIFIFIKLKNH
jgi:membrane-associated protein